MKYRSSVRTYDEEEVHDNYSFSYVDAEMEDVDDVKSGLHSPDENTKPGSDESENMGTDTQYFDSQQSHQSLENMDMDGMPVDSSKLLIITLVTSIGGLLSGYSLSVISPALPSLSSSLDISAVNAESLVGIIYFGGFFGALFAGFMCDFFGRKYTIVLTALIFFIGTIFEISGGFVSLMIGRFIIGVGIVFSTIANTTYLTEMALVEHEQVSVATSGNEKDVSTSKRGAVVAFNELCVCFGGVMAYLDGFGENGTYWKHMLSVFPLLMVFIQTFCIYYFNIPESPLWITEYYSDKIDYDYLKELMEENQPENNNTVENSSDNDDQNIDGKDNEDEPTMNDNQPLYLRRSSLENASSALYKAYSVKRDDSERNFLYNNGGDDHTTHQVKKRKEDSAELKVHYVKCICILVFLSLAQVFCGHENVLNYAPELFHEVTSTPHHDRALNEEYPPPIIQADDLDDYFFDSVKHDDYEDSSLLGMNSINEDSIYESDMESINNDESARLGISSIVDNPRKYTVPPIYLGLLRLIVTFWTMYEIDNTSMGRRKLFLIGAGIMTISLFLLCLMTLIYFSFTGNVFALLAMGTSGLIIGHSASFGTLSTLIISEIFPTKTRGRALALSMMIYSFAAWLYSYSFLEAKPYDSATEYSEGHMYLHPDHHYNSIYKLDEGLNLSENLYQVDSSAEIFYYTINVSAFRFYFIIALVNLSLVYVGLPETQYLDEIDVQMKQEGLWLWRKLHSTVDKTVNRSSSINTFDNEIDVFDEEEIFSFIPGFCFLARWFSRNELGDSGSRLSWYDPYGIRSSFRSSTYSSNSGNEMEGLQSGGFGDEHSDSGHVIT